MNAEEIIKSKLDGWFYSVDPEFGRTITKTVPLDYIPDYKFKDVDPEFGYSNAYQWTPEEDDLIIELRHGGAKWADIGKRLKLSATTPKNRYYDLCKMRGIEPLNNDLTKPWRFDKATRDRAIAMRLAGMMFKEIAAELGITTVQANHIFIRWDKRQKELAEAA
jgi:hypothetical protein